MVQAQFIHDGDAIDYIPGTDVSAGDVVVLGDLVCIAKRDIKANTLGALAVTGVFDVAKESGGSVSFSAGVIVYWDATNKVAVSSSSNGTNKRMGKAVADAANTDVIVRVRLSQ